MAFGARPPITLRLELGGVFIPRGARVHAAIASANRDEAQWEEADRLDLRRARNRHLTFGEGAHYCLGAALARVEGHVAFADLLAAYPDLRLAVAPGELRWRPHFILRGLEALPVRAG